MQGSSWAANQTARSKGRGNSSIKDGAEHRLRSWHCKSWKIQQTHGGPGPTQLTSESGAMKEKRRPSQTDAPLAGPSPVPEVAASQLCRVYPCGAPAGRLLLSPRQCLPFPQSRSLSYHLPGEGPLSLLGSEYTYLIPPIRLFCYPILPL